MNYRGIFISTGLSQMSDTCKYQSKYVVIFSLPVISEILATFKVIPLSVVSKLLMEINLSQQLDFPSDFYILF